jgi:NADH-quinone oxidoreductase subunit A
LSRTGPCSTFRAPLCEFFHEVGQPALPLHPMVRNYLPVLLLLAFAIMSTVLILGIAHIISARQRPTAVKKQPYESGMAPLGGARERFSVKFYLIAMLFIVFDIETVFMIPWAVHYRQLSCAVPMVNEVCPPGSVSFFGLGEMLVFAFILIIGFIYVWKKGALTWE